MSVNSLHDNLPKDKDPTSNEGRLIEPRPFVHDQFLFFGDSITQSDGDPTVGFSCYQALQHGTSTRVFKTSSGPAHIPTNLPDYSRRIDIVKRGFSGYNTVNALSILPRIFPSPEQGRVSLVVSGPYTLEHLSRRRHF